MQTQSITSRFFFVRSSDPTLFYRIGIDSRGLFTCECRDYTYRHRDCKHIKAHQAGKSIEARRVRRQPAPAVQPLRPQSQIDELYGEPQPARIAATPAGRRRGLTMAV